MAAPQPPTEQQQAPEAQAPQPQQAPAPEAPPGDRILSPEEAENLIRGYSITGPSEAAPSADDTPADQRQMAQEFFAEIPPERTAQQTPSVLPPRPPGQDPMQVPLPHEQMQQAQQVPVPPRPPAGVVEQAVQQTLVAGAPTPPQQVPVQTQVSPEMAALQSQNQLLQAQIGVMQQQMQQPPVQQPQAPAAPPPPRQTYDFQIPPQYMAALQSTENPAQAQLALNSILNGVAEAVTNQVRQENQALRDEVQQQVRSTVSESGLHQEIQRDMYGTYPELAGHREFVQAAARRLNATMPQGTPWSADLRDHIAESVAPMVPGLYQKIQQIRAQRVGAYAVPQQQYQQPLPQQQQPAGMLPPGVTPVGVAGGVHGQPPTLARDAQGNLVYVQGAPQPYLGSPQARQSGSAVPPDVMDIWRTLEYEPYR